MTTLEKGALRNGGQRLKLIGMAVWSSLAFASALSWLRLDLIQLLFLLAPWIVVPVGLGLIPSLGKSLPGNPLGRQRWIVFCAASLATCAFFLPEGPIAGSLAFCWFLVCACISLDGLIRIWTFRAGSFSEFCFAVAEGYLVVGGVWLVLSRLGLQPMGFTEPIVLLTAVHFHFAGFLSCVLAGLTYRYLQATHWAKPLRIVLLGTLLGPGALGLAFPVSPRLKLIAAMMVVIGECGLAAGMGHVGTMIAPGLAGRLLQFSAGCVVVGMVFAALWAMGEYPLQPMTDLSHMARIHGVLNSVGFGLAGLLGWATVQRSAE